MTTFVLVHGGGCTSNCWNRVAPLVDGDVVAVDLPGRGRRPGDVSAVRLTDNVAAVVEDIETSGAAEVVLVGHSMAGLTVAHVLNEVPALVRHVVLVSCIVPPHGSSVVGNIDPEVRAAVLAGSGGGVFRLDEATAREILCNDMDEEQSAFALAGLVGEATAVLDEPVHLTGLWGPVPVTYVRLAADKTLPPEQQSASIDAIRAGGKDVAEVELAAGHMVMISQPAALADVLNAVVAG
jgi:pimeloyl-ACP methyl ester carboxylesterase